MAPLESFVESNLDLHIAHCLLAKQPTMGKVDYGIFGNSLHTLIKSDKESPMGPGGIELKYFSSKPKLSQAFDLYRIDISNIEAGLKDSFILDMDIASYVEFVTSGVMAWSGYSSGETT